MKKNTIVLFIVLLSAFSFASSAQDRIELEGMSIIGNKELPKMLYIVPWKNYEERLV